MTYQTCILKSLGKIISQNTCLLVEIPTYLLRGFEYIHYMKCVFLSSLWESKELASFSPFAFNILKASKLEMNGLKSLSGHSFSISKIIKLISQFCFILQASLKYMHICSKAVLPPPPTPLSHFMIQYVCFQDFGRNKCFLWGCSD